MAEVSDLAGISEKVDEHDEEQSSHDAESHGSPHTEQMKTAAEHNANEKSGSRPPSLRLTRSHNGYSCDNVLPPENFDEERGPDEKDPFEVEWEGGDSDPMCPRSWNRGRRWFIVMLCSFTSACVACTSSIYSEVYTQVERELHSSEEVVTLGLSLFVVGLGLGPMFLAPLSEFYGRRPIYVTSMFFFVIWNIPCALAKNIQTEIIGRFLDGFAGSAFLSVAGGTVGDLFPRQELQAPMLFFTAAPFVGPSLGPLIGGFINQYTDWRWTFYVVLIWSGVMWALVIFFVPETYHPVCLKHKAAKIRKEAGDDRYKSKLENSTKTVKATLWRSVKVPVQLLTMEPMVLCLCLFSALLLGILYLFFGAFPLVFGNNHGFDLSQNGMTFLGILVGMIIGICCDPLFQKNYDRLVRNRELAGGEPGGSEPEFRLPPLIVGAPLVTIGIFWFAWTSYSSIPWIVPILGSGVFGAGVVLSFSGCFTFLVDSYPQYAASALAANSFTRSTIGAGFPLFGTQMYNNLGYEWASSLLAFLALAACPFPFIFFYYGRRLRGNSRFAASIQD